MCVFLENFSGEDWDVMQGLHLHFNCRLHPLIQSLCNCTQVFASQTYQLLLSRAVNSYFGQHFGIMAWATYKTRKVATQQLAIEA